MIRPESPLDADAIHALTVRAFDGHPHSDGSEPAIIRRLRAAGALSLSLVEPDGDALRGHIALSPVTLNGQHWAWYGLGPVSVAPQCQGQGVGSRLVRAALDWLRTQSAAGCVVLGDPAWYGRFGFRPHAGLVCPGLPPEYFMALPLRPDTPLPQGEVGYHGAFWG